MDNTNKLYETLLNDTKNELHQCFRTETLIYTRGNTIMNYSNEGISRLGIIVEGDAILYSLDLNGNRNILEHLTKDSVFGEMFILSNQFQTYCVESKTECKVLFLNYDFLINQCDHTCIHHSKILANIMHLIALKNKETLEHLNIVSQRTIRNKLLAYFAYLGLGMHKPEITIPVTWTEVADYICVERTSMMRELKNMNTADIIANEGRYISIGENYLMEN